MIAQYIVSGGTLASVVLGFLRLHRGQQEIHVLVNSKLDEALARSVQLSDKLVENGIEIPVDPADG